MSNIFNEAVGNFVRNFAYRDTVAHLMKHGYTAERMIQEGFVSMSIKETERMMEEIKKEEKE